MNPFEEDVCWSVFDDYNTINDFDVSDFYLTSLSANATAGTSLNGNNTSAEKSQKRARDTCLQTESKACRERLRREKMNDRFSELRKILSPGRPAKSDKSSILQDAICALYRLKSEHQELIDRKKKLQDDSQNLKEEKKELNEETLQLQGRKQKIEQQIKAMSVTPSAYVTMQPAGGHKGVVVSGYGGYPMWQWIPHSVLDISQDHVLRPPVA